MQEPIHVEVTHRVLLKHLPVCEGMVQLAFGSKVASGLILPNSVELLQAMCHTNWIGPEPQRGRSQMELLLGEHAHDGKITETLHDPNQKITKNKGCLFPECSGSLGPCHQ